MGDRISSVLDYRLYNRGESGFNHMTSQSYVSYEAHKAIERSTKFPIMIEVSDVVEEVIYEAFQGKNIKDQYYATIEQKRRQGELTQEQMDYLDIFDFDYEDWEIKDGGVVIFRFGFEHHCGFVVDSGVNTVNGFPNGVPYTQRCQIKESDHNPRTEEHDFISYPIPVPNHG